MSIASDVVGMVRSINGAAFCKVSYETENHGLLKTSKADGSINPFWSQKASIRKVVDGSLINLGVVYENAVDNRAVSRAGGEPGGFESQAMRGKTECTPAHKNLCQSLDGSATYIRYMPMDCRGTMTVRYTLGGQDITAAMLKFKPVKSDVSTQSDVGLSGSDQILWRTLDVSRITRFEGNGVVIE